MGSRGASFNSEAVIFWEGYRDGHFPVKISEGFTLVIPHFLICIPDPPILAKWP